MDKLERTRASLAQIADRLDASRGTTLETWRDTVAGDPTLDAASAWTLKQFNDHFPDVLEALGRALRAWPQAPVPLISEEQAYAVSHARTRWLQGYSLTGVMREWGHFNTVVVDHLMGCVAALPEVDLPAHRVASNVWARLLNDQQTLTVKEYSQLQMAEAETRGAEVQRLLDVVRMHGSVRGRALESLATDMRNDLQLVVTSHKLGSEPGEWHQSYELQKLSEDGFRGLERALVDMVTLAHLEVGHETASKESFDAGHGLELLAEGLRYIAEQKGTSLTAEGPAPFMVQGDAERVRRLAKHLLFCVFRAPNATTAVLCWGPDARNADRWRIEVAQAMDPSASAGSNAAGNALAEATDALQQVSGVEATGYETALQRGLIPVAPGDGVDILIAKHLCELLGASLEVEAVAGSIRYIANLPVR